jgi:hypothetical protein
MDRWKVELVNGQVIVVSGVQLVQMIRSGQIFPSTRICLQGHPWIEAGRTTQFASVFPPNSLSTGPKLSKVLFPLLAVGVVFIVFLGFLGFVFTFLQKPLPNSVSTSSPPAPIPKPHALASKPLSKDAEATGGFGMPRSDWEILHILGKEENSITANYDNEKFWVQFYDENVWHLVCHPLDGGSVTLEEARRISKQYIPKDARFVKTYTSRSGTTVDLYNSKFLIPRFKDSSWPGGKPGDFVVLLKNQTGSVNTFIIGIGNNP